MPPFWPAAMSKLRGKAANGGNDIGQSAITPGAGGEEVIHLLDRLLHHGVLGRENPLDSLRLLGLFEATVRGG